MVSSWWSLVVNTTDVHTLHVDVYLSGKWVQNRLNRLFRGLYFFKPFIINLSKDFNFIRLELRVNFFFRCFIVLFYELSRAYFLIQLFHPSFSILLPHKNLRPFRTFRDLKPYLVALLPELCWNLTLFS